MRGWFSIQDRLLGRWSVRAMGGVMITISEQMAPFVESQYCLSHPLLLVQNSATRMRSVASYHMALVGILLCAVLMLKH
jgi:hypothetical protein